MFQAEQNKIEELVKEYIKNHALPETELNWKGIPFSGQWGISTSFFQIAAIEARQGGKINVGKRAQEIAEGITEFIGEQPGFQRIEALRGYLNLYYSSEEYTKRVVDEVLALGVDFGRSDRLDKKIMVEFSQPNTHKAFHVGHLRNVILGSTVCNLLDYAGYDVVRTNYIGDIGLHVIKWLWNYLENYKGELPGDDKVRWMGNIYSEADKAFTNSPEVEQAVRQLFLRWDRQEPDIVDLWKKTREWSLEGFDELYETLGVSFDKVYYESEVEDSGKEIVEELLERKLAKDERPEGAVIVDLDEIMGTEQKYRVLVILRSDGTSLYSTKDLSLAIKKNEEFDLEQSIYVIDVRQSLYMQQIFKTLELLGYEWAKKCYHLAYEIVNLPGNVTMKSREGTVVLLDDLMKEANQRALEIVKQKNPELSLEEQQTIAGMVAIGAIKYPMLSRDNSKVVTFDWETALDFNGQASPYIQYAYVRANSILKKVDKQIPGELMPEYELTPQEITLINLISKLPQEIKRAAEELKPHHISSLAYEMAKAFSDFYAHCHVLKEEPQKRDMRLRLVAAAQQAIGNALNVLGIGAPDIM
ncbi:MAG: arginine--tRNA ligase [Anaerolineaceae bacterium]|nr:arginine--tRNA ligase [Anaerolineaceae bacterium]